MSVIPRFRTDPPLSPLTGEAKRIARRVPYYQSPDREDMVKRVIVRPIPSPTKPPTRVQIERPRKVTPSPSPVIPYLYQVYQAAGERLKPTGRHTTLFDPAAWVLTAGGIVKTFESVVRPEIRTGSGSFARDVLTPKPTIGGIPLLGSSFAETERWVKTTDPYVIMGEGFGEIGLSYLMGKALSYAGSGAKKTWSWLKGKVSPPATAPSVSSIIGKIGEPPGTGWEDFVTQTTKASSIPVKTGGLLDPTDVKPYRALIKHPPTPTGGGLTLLELTKPTLKTPEDVAAKEVARYLRVFAPVYTPPGSSPAFGLLAGSVFTSILRARETSPVFVPSHPTVPRQKSTVVETTRPVSRSVLIGHLSSVLDVPQDLKSTPVVVSRTVQQLQQSPIQTFDVPQRLRTPVRHYPRPPRVPTPKSTRIRRPTKRVQSATRQKGLGWQEWVYPVATEREFRKAML